MKRNDYDTRRARFFLPSLILRPPPPALCGVCNYNNNCLRLLYTHTPCYVRWSFINNTIVINDMRVPIYAYTICIRIMYTCNVRCCRWIAAIHTYTVQVYLSHTFASVPIIDSAHSPCMRSTTRTYNKSRGDRQPRSRLGRFTAARIL